MCIDQRKRPVRNTNNTRLADAIAAEQVDEYGNPTKPFQRRILQPRKTTTSRKRKQADDASTDVDDDNFVDSPASSDPESESEADNDAGIMIEEVRHCALLVIQPLTTSIVIQIVDILPSKTVPEPNNGKVTSKSKRKRLASVRQKKKLRRHSVEIEEIEDEDSPRRLSAQNAGIPCSSQASCSSIQGSAGPESSNEPTLAKVCIALLGTVNYDIKYQEQHMKKNPIYLFYEVIPNGADGTPGDDGDKHYRCLHGSHKICTIKKSMRGNLNGEFCNIHLRGINFRITVLTNNLRVHVKPMFHLYCLLKGRDAPPTADEIAIASGHKKLDGRSEAEYLKKLEMATENIKKAFENQKVQAAVS
jgi:hypothetical protein